MRPQGAESLAEDVEDEAHGEPSIIRVQRSSVFGEPEPLARTRCAWALITDPSEEVFLSTGDGFPQIGKIRTVRRRNSFRLALELFML